MSVNHDTSLKHYTDEMHTRLRRNNNNDDLFVGTDTSVVGKSGIIAVAMTITVITIIIPCANTVFHLHFRTRSFYEITLRSKRYYRDILQCSRIFLSRACFRDFERRP